MKMTEIIKDAFQFPSRHTGRYAIYLLLSVLIVLFASGGILTYSFGILDAENYLTGGIYIVIAALIGIIVEGYHIKVAKSGIDHDDEVPRFELFNDFMTGFDNFAVLLVYFSIPAILVALVAGDTNLFGNAIDVGREFILQLFNVYIMGGSVDLAVISLSIVLNDFLTSLAITITVALVLFVIFAFLRFIAEARLANTGSLKEALNIYETAKDIRRMGIGRAIIVVLLVLVIIIAIELLLAMVLGDYPFLLSTFCIIITPYFLLVTQRAFGLLYSDIA